MSRRSGGGKRSGRRIQLSDLPPSVQEAVRRQIAAPPKSGAAGDLGAEAPARRKFGNIPDGEFGSRKERRVFEEISFRVRMKDPGYDDVVKIETQVSFLLIPEQKDEEGRVLERAAKYVADIVLYRNDGNITVIDVKSAPTRKHPVYVLKRKLMRHVHGVSIVEI